MRKNYQEFCQQYQKIFLSIVEEKYSCPLLNEIFAYCCALFSKERFMRIREIKIRAHSCFIIYAHSCLSYLCLFVLFYLCLFVFKLSAITAPSPGRCACSWPTRSAPPASPMPCAAPDVVPLHSQTKENCSEVLGLPTQTYKTSSQNL